MSDAQLLIDSLKQYVVTPLNAFGVGGFVFDSEGDTTVNLSADITDHYLEDNTSVQDHIAIKPKRVTPKPTYTVSLDRDARAWVGIPEGMIGAWAKAYPGINVPIEMERAMLWALANPAQTKANWLRFLTNWYARAQERSRPTPSSAAGVSRKPWCPPDDNMTI